MTELITDPDLRDPLKLARSCVAFLDEKKISDLTIFDVGESLSITSYFVIGTGLNQRHLQGVVDLLERHLKERGVRRRGLEGYREGKWILFDLGDVVVHLFQAESRKFYDLELLWGDHSFAQETIARGAAGAVTARGAAGRGAAGSSRAAGGAGGPH